MTTTKIWLFGCVLGLSGMVTSHTWAASESTASVMTAYTNTTLGIQFMYPNRFVIGRYHPEPGFKQAIVLVEPGILGDTRASDIPVGELPAISLNVQKGRKAQFTRSDLCRKEFKTQIGKAIVYKLPGYPGPYGDQSFCYYVPLPRGKMLEALAHRYYFDDAVMTNGAPTHGAPTHYDSVIEGIIKTLRTTTK